MPNPGEKLITAALAARREVTLVAPFVKVSVLQALFDKLDPSVPVRVVGRWIPKEIAAGVCDLEIYDVVKTRSNAALYVHPLLHAKLYRFDDNVFVGSANLTNKALGWAAPSNLELLHPHNEIFSELKAFEDALLRNAIRVDDAYRDLVKAQVEKVKLTETTVVASETSATAGQFWLPTCRVPDRLWSVYTDVDDAKRRMVESAVDAALSDLAILDVEAGLSRQLFNQNIAATLSQIPLVQAVDEASKRPEGLTSAQAVALIQGKLGEASWPHSAVEMWEVLQAWLTFFFPQRYRTEPATEVFRQGRILG